jgi:tellurite resistance protein
MEIQKCHEWYVSERGTFLSIDHFSSMIMMLPATMVACSDGDFDELEKQNLANSCKEIDANEHVGFEVYAELCHLVGAGAADQRSKVLD